MWPTVVNDKVSSNAPNPNARLVQGSYGKEKLKKQALKKIDGQVQKDRVEFVISDELDCLMQVWSGVDFKLYKELP